jgi:short-chain Z-isoprenyl diphosphate synthase
MIERIGIILDGNRRWAAQRGMTPTQGHRAGFSLIPDVIDWCADEGIRHVTLWMMSTDNLSRSQTEVDGLMDIITDVIGSMAGHPTHAIQVVGDTALLPTDVQDILHKAETASPPPEKRRITAHLAIAYGGRWEILQAVRSLLRDAARTGTTLQDLARNITVDTLTTRMPTRDADPQLLIRTSGERRSSGFMPWVDDTCRWWFTPNGWPDFNRDTLKAALADTSPAHKDTP